MTITSKHLVDFRWFAVCMALLQPIAPSVHAQKSPSSIIGDLVRPGGRAIGGGFFTCGSINAETQESHRIATSLVDLGETALPELEKALASLQRDGQHSQFAPNGGWLLFAYANIRLDGAYPLLRSMMDMPQLAFLQTAISSSIAVALKLTSYVDSGTGPHDTICRKQEPRDSMNQVILAFERGEQDRLRSNIGPEAEAALGPLPRRKSNGSVAMGYRFVGAGRWSEPEPAVGGGELLPNNLAGSEKFDISAEFTGSAGNPCGTFAVRFRKMPIKGTALVKYVVDNANIADLAQAIETCVAGKSKVP